MNQKCIATSSDHRYFPALMALLRSLERSNPGIPVVVFDGGLTRRQKSMVRRLARIMTAEPVVNIEGRGKFSYIGNTTLLKFSVAELRYDKVLYLDSDMVVLEKVDALFEIPEGKVGVVNEVNALKNMFRSRHREMLMNSLDLDWEEPGFNAGLFVLRPSEWRDLPSRVKHLVGVFGEEVFSKTKDQQLLNLIFRKHVHELPSRYNFSPFYDNGENGPPAIIHYLTGLKPWHKDYPRGKYYSEFRKHLKWTDYPRIALVDLSRRARPAGRAFPGDIDFQERSTGRGL